MHENKKIKPYSSDSSLAEAPELCCMNTKKTSFIKPAQSLSPARKSKLSEIEGISEESLNKISASSSQDGFLSGSSNTKGNLKGIRLNEGKVYSTPEFLVSNCWDSSRADAALKLVDFFKEANAEEDDLDVPIKKRRLEAGAENDKSPPYTREFHMLTEVQKSKILTAVEDTIKKLAVDDCYQGFVKDEQRVLQPIPNQAIGEQIICKKFLLPWVLMKVSEMLVCHIIQFTFLSDSSYFEKENEFLPIVVTYYLTLFVIVISLLVHISCFSYANLQNPCYFMGVISSSILTLTTTMGMLIMLSTMNYYKTYRQILVLFFLSFLAFLLFAELYLFYVEVKSMWNRMEQIDQNYIT